MTTTEQTGSLAPTGPAWRESLQFVFRGSTVAGTTRADSCGDRTHYDGAGRLLHCARDLGGVEVEWHRTSGEHDPNALHLSNLCRFTDNHGTTYDDLDVHLEIAT